MDFSIFGKNINYILNTKYNGNHPSFQKALNLSNGMIGKYIKGQKPSIETLDRLKELTGYTIDDLLYKDLSAEE